ncbi:MAG: ATP phosphoribosyltransferase regulatory subunit [Acidobacteria bacterium]|nr:ATP phosphoribosyltransferase regulatory subunit [Acidobacteriota bacterium]
MKVTAALPSGVSALFFDSARQRRRLEARLVELLEGCGYGEVILPILDYLEPYEPLLSPAARGELYRFIDRTGEQLALRADFTPMLARLLAPRLAAMELPLRLYYRGDVVRYHEERPGRQRESHQMGAELLGVEGGAAEKEVFELFLSMLQASGLEQVRVALGFAGSLDALARAAVGEEKAAELLAAIDRRERPAVAALGGLPARALRSVLEEGVPEDLTDLGEGMAANIEALDALREDMLHRFPDFEITLDLAEFASLSRPLAARGPTRERSYYDGFLFRAYSAGGAQPLGSGGRYDSLFRRLGAEVAAVGFSLSMERVLAEPSVREVPRASCGGPRS